MRGGGAIIGPDGDYLAGPVFDAPAILAADLDLDRLRGERMNLDVTGHYSRPDAFEFRVVPSRRSATSCDR
jgi:nitrilase